MERRDFVRLGLAAATAAPMTGKAAAGVDTDAVLDAGVREQQALMEAGRLTAKTLVQRYLARIAAAVKVFILTPRSFRFAAIASQPFPLGSLIIAGDKGDNEAAAQELIRKSVRFDAGANE